MFGLLVYTLSGLLQCYYSQQCDPPSVLDASHDNHSTANNNSWWPNGNSGFNCNREKFEHAYPAVLWVCHCSTLLNSAFGFGIPSITGIYTPSQSSTLPPTPSPSGEYPGLSVSDKIAIATLTIGIPGIIAALVGAYYNRRQLIEAIQHHWGRWSEIRHQSSFLQTLEVHSGFINAATFSQDVKQVALAPNHEMVRLGDSATGASLYHASTNLQWLSRHNVEA